jgi:seryl-tRNA synthetase
MRLERALVDHALRAAAGDGYLPVAPPSIVYRAVAGACGFRPRAGAGSEVFDVTSAPAAGEHADHHHHHHDNHLARPAAPPHVLAGTAEIPLAGLFAGRTLPAEQAPAKLVGVSRCFRAEAGARGRRDRGLFRVHEFTKVELFAWCAPDPEPAEGKAEVSGGAASAVAAEAETWYDENLEKQLPDVDGHAYVAENTPDATTAPGSAAAAAALPRHLDPRTDTQSARLLRGMLALQRAIHAPLGLPLRTLLLPAHDLGASAALKVDLETLFSPGDASSSSSPTTASDGEEGQGGGPRWGEITSLSLCADYQARRLGVRVQGAGGGAAPRFAWSLNGTALAVPRVWAAVVEAGWDADRGVVRLPQCLWGLMGMREIRRR